MRLFRPTGLRELRLVADSAWRAWPPRLPDQPIFYPVLTLEYARKIARDWNAVDDNVGFVTEFDIDDSFAARYPIQDAAGRSHQELWVPAEELPEFNKHIIGTIRVIDAFAGPNYSSAIDPRTNLPVGFDGEPESETALRFSERTDEYVRHRPSYPIEVVRTLERELGLSPELTRVVDLGCGTGISAALFLDRGYAVTGVEPSARMRAEAIARLGRSSRFSVVAGAAERVALPDSCCELIIAAQAFHWFDVEASRAEMRRLLVKGGHVALFWNVRRTNSTPFLAEYEKVLQQHLPEYAARTTTLSGQIAQLFEANAFQQRVFPNHQQADEAGLLGRAISSSYVPRPDAPTYATLRAALVEAFARHAQDGTVTLEHDTTLYFGQLGGH